MSEEIAIRVENVSKDFKLPHEKSSTLKGLFTGLVSKKRRGYENQHALKNISFEVKTGEFFGIVGRNGSGKSTLLKILANIYQPNKGTVEVRGKLVPFIELGVGFNPELSGRENVFLNGALLGFSRKEMQAMYSDIVDFAELERFMDQKLKNYSSGMQVRLAFSMAIRANADVLLVDEVLAVGDADFQRKCFEYFKTLKQSKKTVVFVSHDMSAVREFCDRALLVDDSKIQAIGETSKIADQYSQLFMDITGENAANNGKRWGNEDATITRATAKLEDDEVLIDIDVRANKNIDRVIYGLHIVAQDGAEVTAMNNRMLRMPDIENFQKGSIVNLRWKVLNVFNDGKYFITLTLIDDVTNTLDWWVDAASFIIKRPERSTTPVLPPITVRHKIK